MRSIRGIDSKILLKEVVDMVHRRGFEIDGVDLTIIAQKPRLSKYKDKISKSLSKLLQYSKPQGKC